MDYNSFFDSFVDMMNVMRTNVSYWCNCYPFAEQKFSYSVQSHGVFFNSYEDQTTGEIVDVLKGSDAYNKGLRAGDKIMRIYNKGGWLIFALWGKSVYFKADSYEEKSKSWIMPAFYIPIPIPFRRKITLYKYDYLGEDFKSNSTSGKRNYEILDSSGQKIKIKSKGFKLSTYNYEYIY